MICGDICADAAAGHAAAATINSVFFEFLIIASIDPSFQRIKQPPSLDNLPGRSVGPFPPPCGKDTERFRGWRDRGAGAGRPRDQDLLDRAPSPNMWSVTRRMAAAGR